MISGAVYLPYPRDHELLPGEEGVVDFGLAFVPPRGYVGFLHLTDLCHKETPLRLLTTFGENTKKQKTKFV
jgi:hypothetical protein